MRNGSRGRARQVWVLSPVDGPQLALCLLLCIGQVSAAAQDDKAKAAGIEKARKAAGKLLCARKYKEAAEAYDKLVPQARALGDPALLTSCLMGHMNSCARSRRFEDAIASAAECMKPTGDEEQKSWIVAQCRYFHAHALYCLKRKEEAREAFVSFFNDYRGDSGARKAQQYAMGVWPRWGPELIGLDKAIEVHRQNLVNIFLRPEVGAPTRHTYQRGLVEMLLKAKRTEDALAEAKLYFYIAPLDDRYTQEAIRWISSALKACDGTIHRLNQFLSFQRYGPAGQDGKPGTDDDLKNVLPSVEVATTPERDQMLQDVLDKQPDDYRGHRLRGYVYLFMDKPKEAVAEFKLAYQLCPVEEKAVQQAVDDAAVGLRAYHGTVLAAQEFLEFQQYGPNGGDGKKGTEDDIEDPLKEF